jgi:hypothetical protein
VGPSNKHKTHSTTPQKVAADKNPIFHKTHQPLNCTNSFKASKGFYTKE